MIRPLEKQLSSPDPESFVHPPAQGRPAKDPRRARRLARWRLPLLVLAMPMVVAGGFSALRPAPSVTAPIASPRPPSVVGLGFIEPASTIIKVGAPGSPDALRIAELKIKEGDEVEAGQVLATLDTAIKLAAQAEAAEVQLRLKRLTLEKHQVEIAANATSRRSALERAGAELSATTAEYDRQMTLLNRGVTTLANVEKKKRELLTAQATVREMEAALKRIETQTKSPAAVPGTLIDIAVTEQEVAVAEADLKVARASLELAIIRSPLKGRVLSIKTRAGERIGNDGVLEIGATQTMRAVIEVYQTDIGRVRIGQSVSIRTTVLDAPIVGVVERISPTVKRQSVVNNDPATATDSRVVEVFVSLDGKSGEKVAALSRLQVQGVFQP